MAKRSQPMPTQLQYDFIKNYIGNGFNAEQAAIKAGYELTTARTGACNMIHSPAVKPHVDKALERAQDTIVNKLGMSLEWRLKKLKKLINIYIPDDAEKIPAEHASVAIKAISEVNKMSGDYAPDKRLSLTVDLTKDKLKTIKRMYEDY